MSLHLFKSKAYLRVQVPQRIAQIGGPRRRHVGSALQQFFVVRKAVENEHGLQTLLLTRDGVLNEQMVGIMFSKSNHSWFILIIDTMMCSLLFENRSVWIINTASKAVVV